MNLTLIVPIYNERSHLPEFVEQVRALRDGSLGADSEILLVDDGSTDGSAEWLASARLPDGFRVLRHVHNRGYGAAIKTGLRVARHEIVAIADADGTYPIESVPDLAGRLEASDEVSMVVGARTGAASTRAIPPLRRPAKWILTRLAEHLTERRIPDLNSGLRAFRRAAVSPYLHLAPDGFSLTTTLTLALLTNGHEVVWQRIDYRPRHGESKIRPVRDTLGFLQLILRIVLYFNPLKFFLPASLALFALGCVLLLARLLSPNPVGVATTVILFVAALQVLALGLLADLIDKRLR